jgi:hypothetical protein
VPLDHPGHALDFILAQPAAVVSDGDVDVVRPSRGSVLGQNIQDAVGVDVKGDTMLGTPTGARGMPERSNVPSRLLSLVLALSPSNTGKLTVTWLS